MKKLLFVALLFSVFLPANLSAEEISDPIEPFNRGVFWFNDTFDTYLLEPVATGYHWVMPDFAEQGVTNFFENLRYPQYLFNNVIQGEFGQAGQHTVRFVVNTIFGIGGLFDVATKIGLEENQYEDTDLSFANFGIPRGPYIVLPFLGPSTLRHTGGRIVDSFLDPVYWIALEAEEGTLISVSAKALDIINFRASKLEAVKSAKEGTLDYYAAVRAAYFQSRNSLEKGEEEPDEDDAFLNEELE